MPASAKVINGKKYMWNNGTYPTEKEAREEMTQYEANGFEVECLEEDKNFLLYTRRLVTEIVIEEGGQIL